VRLKSQLQTGPLSEEQLENLNRARDFFGDPMQRWNDRISPERISLLEEYRSGRLAFILHYDSLQSLFESDTRGIAHKVQSFSDQGSRFLILKAHVTKLHKLQKWDKHLMLVPNVENVERPQPSIPTLVGFNSVEHERGDWNSDLLLFHSAIYKTYKLVPSIEYWKTRVTSDCSAALQNHSAPKMVEGRTKIVQTIANGESQVIEGEQGFVDIETDEIRASIILNSHTVKVTLGEFASQQFCLLDVLLGPLNLEVR